MILKGGRSRRLTPSIGQWKVGAGETNGYQTMKLPRGVALKHGRYYARRNKRWIPLSRADEGERALAKAIAELSPDTAPRTIGELLIEYRREGTKELSAVTRKEYERMIDGELTVVFGRMRLEALTTSIVAQHLERGKREKRAVAVNRERAVLSAAYEFGLRRGFVQSNPCRGVKRNTERPRSRYVTHAELRRLIVGSPVQFRDLIWVAYLTGMRLTDLRQLRRDALNEKGVEVTESKTGKRKLYEWTPLLRAVVRRALRRADSLAIKRKRPASPWVLTNRFGQQWSQAAVSSEIGRQVPGFRFRDLRRKAASDADHNVLGHSGQMLRRYVDRERLKPLTLVRH